MGVHTHPTHTYTPPNHNSALSYPDHVMSHIQKELSLLIGDPAPFLIPG